MPLLGAHMSIAGNPSMALKRGGAIGCRVIQIFTRNRLTWSGKELSSGEIEAFNRIRMETSIIPIAIHGSYLINLASPVAKVRSKSLLLLIHEMGWSRQLNIPYLVVHPGFHMGAGEDRGIKTVAGTIARALERTEGYEVIILLETTAGQGTTLGYRFEHLAEIIHLTGFRNRLGICLDTCHVFAAGYDFRTKEAYGQIIEEFDNVIGIDRLKLFHINDSKGEPGSLIDRHDHPGKGLIGLEPFSFFLNDPLFSEHAFLLETPKGKDAEGMDRDLANIRILEKLIKRGSA